MKILVISNMWPSPANKTFGIFVKDQVDWLRKSHVVKVVALPYRANKVLRVFDHFGLCCKVLFSSGFDIIHAHYTVPSGLFGLWLKKLRGKPMVVTSHGGDIRLMAARNTFFRWLTQKVMDGADKVIAVGADLQQRIMKEYGVPQEKIVLMPCGVDTSLFKPKNKSMVRRKLKLLPKKKIILSVGALIERKGVGYLLKAVKALGSEYDLQVIVIGEGPLREKLEKEAQGLPVRFEQFKSRKELARWMAAADVFVFPSLAEPFGLVGIEALACNIPVIGSNVGGIPEFVKDNENGFLVKPKDWEGIAEKLHLLLSDQVMHHRLASQGRKSIDEYAIDRQNQKLISLYHKLSETFK